MVALTKHSHLIFGRLPCFHTLPSHSSLSNLFAVQSTRRPLILCHTYSPIVGVHFFNAYLCTKRMAIIMWMVYAINVNKRYMVDWKDYYGVRCGMMMLEDILLYDCCCCCYYMHNVNVSNEQTNKQNNNGNSNKEPKDWKNHCRQHWRPIQFFKRHRSHFEVSFVLDKQQFHNGHKHSFFTEKKVVIEISLCHPFPPVIAYCCC